jgi:hypothetical protein
MTFGAKRFGKKNVSLSAPDIIQTYAENDHVKYPSGCSASGPRFEQAACKI